MASTELRNICRNISLDVKGISNITLLKIINRLTKISRLVDSDPDLKVGRLVNLNTIERNMKKILCVVDFSETSEKVLKVAADLANASKAHLIVLFPYRLIDQDHGGDINALKTRLETEAKRKFQDLTNCLPGLKKVVLEFHPEIGFVVGRINAYLAKNNIDIVIIGEHQVKERNNQHNGDLEKLISTSRVPFIIVPPKVSAETNVRQFKTA